MIDTQVRIINKHGKDVAQDGIEKGDIVVKGNGVISDDIGDFTEDGWLYTGDIGTIDEDGRIEVVDREQKTSKDGSNKVSPVEIESVLGKHHAVEEVAVILVPHKSLGETLHAFIVLHENTTATEQEFIEFTRGNLPDAQLTPTAITFIDELPKTTSGKILKVQLAEFI